MYIIKKFIATICIICLVFNVTTYSCCAQDVTQEDILSVLLQSISPEDTELVYRGDCWGVIMQAIGLSTRENVMHSRDTIYERRVYYEQGHDRANDGYIILGCQENLVKGRSVSAEYDVIVFEPFEYVTYKECLMFMLRCLCDSNSVQWDNVEDLAVDMGLITEPEVECFDEVKLLDYKTFKTLLGKMLLCNRYLYYYRNETSSIEEIFSIAVDTEGKISYVEWILNTDTHWISKRLHGITDGTENDWSFEKGFQLDIDFREIQTNAKTEVLSIFNVKRAEFEYIKNALTTLTPENGLLYIRKDESNPYSFDFFINDIDYNELFANNKDEKLVDSISNVVLDNDTNIIIRSTGGNKLIEFRIWTDCFFAGIIFTENPNCINQFTETLNLGDGWYYYRTKYL